MLKRAMSVTIKKKKRCPFWPLFSIAVRFTVRLKRLTQRPGKLTPSEASTIRSSYRQFLCETTMLTSSEALCEFVQTLGRTLMADDATTHLAKVHHLPNHIITERQVLLIMRSIKEEFEKKFTTDDMDAFLALGGNGDTIPVHNVEGIVKAFDLRVEVPQFDGDSSRDDLDSRSFSTRRGTPKLHYRDFVKFVHQGGRSTRDTAEHSSIGMNGLPPSHVVDPLSVHAPRPSEEVPSELHQSYPLSFSGSLRAASFVLQTTARVDFTAATTAEDHHSASLLTRLQKISVDRPPGGAQGGDPSTAVVFRSRSTNARAYLGDQMFLVPNHGIWKRTNQKDKLTRLFHERVGGPFRVPPASDIAVVQKECTGQNHQEGKCDRDHRAHVAVRLDEHERATMSRRAASATVVKHIKQSNASASCPFQPPSLICYLDQRPQSSLARRLRNLMPTKSSDELSGKPKFVLSNVVRRNVLGHFVSEAAKKAHTIQQEGLLGSTINVAALALSSLHRCTVLSVEEQRASQLPLSLSQGPSRDLSRSPSVASQVKKKSTT